MTVPVINTDRALRWLLFLVHAKGACLVTETLDADLLGTEGELLRRYAGAALVNATGLGSRVLAADEGVYLVRGALLRVRNPVIEGWKLRWRCRWGCFGGRRAVRGNGGGG